MVDACKDGMSVIWETGVVDDLLKRFKEREESVRVAILGCFAKVVKHSVRGGKAVAGKPATGYSGQDDVEMEDAEAGESKFDSPGSLAAAVGRKSAAVVKACEKQLRAKKGNEKTKTAALALLGELCGAPGGLGDAGQVEVVIGVVSGCLAPGAPKSLKLDALVFLQTALACNGHPPSSVQPHIKKILPLVSMAVQEDWYKIIAEALR